MAGKYFEEFTIGDQFISKGRTITETDVVNYAGFSGDYNPIHTDREFASCSAFGERIAHGMLGACVGIGLWCRLGITEGTAIALLESNWKFTSPIRFGDTIHTVATILEKRSVSKPGRGIVNVGLDIVNQHGATAQKGTLVLMIQSKERLTQH